MEPGTPSSRTCPSQASLELARRLFEREVHGAAGDEAMLAAADRVCTHLLSGLSRWLGPYGSLALVERALRRASSRHPSLRDVGLTHEQPAALLGVAEAGKLYGADAVTSALVGMLAELSDITARLIGERLAHSLLEQSTNDEEMRGDAHPRADEP